MSKKIKTTKILFTGGGTAGHIFPIIALARELRRLSMNWKFFYLGPKDDFASVLLSQEDIKIKTVWAGKIRRYWNWQSILQNIIDIFFKAPLGFCQSFFILLLIRPRLIFSKGGYGSVAAVFWGWFFRVPILLHESDIAPGLANRFLSKLVAKILVSFSVSQTEYFSEDKMIAVGNPIRREILAGSKERSRELFNLSGKKPVILVMGGSQGAQKINDAILAVLPLLLAELELIHQTGEKNLKQVRAEASVVVTEELKKYYHPVGFLKEIELREALAVADMVLSRAGAGTIFEIAACQKPSILIPLALAAQDHQVKNAYAYSLSKAAIVIEEANLTPYFLLEKLKYLFSHPQELEKMSLAAKNFAQPESAKTIANYIMNYVR